MPESATSLVADARLLAELQAVPFWVDPGVDPAVLAKFLGNQYETDWLTWEPETLRTTLEKEQSVIIPPEVWEKIMALRSIIWTDSFWKRWEVFEKVSCAFNQIRPDFGQMQHLSTANLSIAVNCANAVRKLPFAEEVKCYLAAKLAEDGLVITPTELEPCQTQLDKLNSASSINKEEAKNYKLTEKVEAGNPAYMQKLMVTAVNLYVALKEKIRAEQMQKVTVKV